MVKVVGVASFALVVSAFFCQAQTNSWTNSAGGNWEDPYWSLGILPGTNQTIFFTNEGSKTLIIGPATANTFPGSLTVDTIMLGGETGSTNAFLLNNAGLQTPLTARFLTVASNSVMTIRHSALYLDGNNGDGMSIGGEFNQDDSSQVTGQQLDLGYIGPGIYNLNSGLLTVTQIWIGGPYHGAFNQNGGINSADIVHIESGGTYDMSDGDFSAILYFPYGGSTFLQHGGRIHSVVTVHKGRYVLAGGMNYGGVTSPVGDGWTGWSGNGAFVQTGGTNFGPVKIGTVGEGSYTLSNGVTIAPSLDVGGGGIVEQTGGILTVTGALSVWGNSVGFDGTSSTWGWGSLLLNGGHLRAHDISVEGFYTQNGGTNVVLGSFHGLRNSPSRGVHMRMNGGLLKAWDMIAESGVVQTGGIIIVTHSLILRGVYGDPGMPWFGPDFDLTGGELLVSNLVLRSGHFRLASESFQQSGSLTMLGAMLMTDAGAYTFGPLKLASCFLDTNSFISLPPGNGCLIHFADSDGMEWTNTTALMITNWSGSLYGGGRHQIIFGTNATALTPQQLSQIRFANPAGLPPGTYPARILATGEIVPDTGDPLPPRIEFSGTTTNGAVGLRVAGNIGETYGIECSTDLVHWMMWTSQDNATGTIPFADANSTNFSQRFYRARRLPSE